MDVQEAPVPGVGTKFTFRGPSGEFSVISKIDGSKEIYFVQNDNLVVIPLLEDEAKTLAMLLMEINYEKREGREEIRTGKSIIRWIRVDRDMEIPANEFVKDALFIIRNGRIERDLGTKPRKGDIIFAGE